MKAKNEVYFVLIMANAYHYVNAKDIKEGKSFLALCGKELYIDYEHHRAFIDGSEVANQVFLTDKIGPYTSFDGRNLLEELFRQAGIML